jgi:hypothetical protein
MKTQFQAIRRRLPRRLLPATLDALVSVDLYPKEIVVVKATSSTHGVSGETRSVRLMVEADRIYVDIKVPAVDELVAELTEARDWAAS